MKRLVDIVAALLLLTLLAPVIALLMIIVRLDSRGPALFVQERAGKRGKPFRFTKLRTMRRDVDPYGSSPKDGGDPRLTRMGRWLRETSLDELPQLWHVLTGDMSLVGPRPLYVAQIAEWNDEQKQRLNVKPGLTGLAQVSGRGALTQEEKLALDVTYVRTQSFWLDLRILGATFASVLGRQSIYEKRYSQNRATRGE